MEFLRGIINGLTLVKVKSAVIRESLNMESLLLQLEDRNCADMDM